MTSEQPLELIEGLLRGRFGTFIKLWVLTEASGLVDTSTTHVDEMDCMIGRICPALFCRLSLSFSSHCRFEFQTLSVFMGTYTPTIHVCVKLPVLIKYGIKTFLPPKGLG